jgi:hypothetical protein
MPTLLQSPRVQRRAFRVAVVLLTAGAFALAAVLIGGRGEPERAAPAGTPAAASEQPTAQQQQLAPAARRTAQRFIQTAVARKDLRAAYALAGPQIRQGQTLEQWLTGNIAVVPYPVDRLDLASMKVDYAVADEASIQVALLPKAGSGVKGQIFFMDLIRRDGRWLVDSWVPRSSPQVPVAPG